MVTVNCLNCKVAITNPSNLRFCVGEGDSYHLEILQIPELVRKEVNPNTKKRKISPEVLKHSLCNAKIGNVMVIGFYDQTVYTLSRDEVYLSDESPNPKQKKWKEIYKQYAGVIKVRFAKDRVLLTTNQKPIYQTIFASTREHLIPLHLKKTTPRKYQVELYIQCLLQSSLVCVPTGCGKTLISILFIDRMLNLNPNKIAVFITHRIPLVYQQSEYINKETSHKVLKLCGEVSHITSKLEKMKEENQRVLCITAQCLLNCLNDTRLRIDDFCAMVFDEAHNGTGNHPFVKIMEVFNKAKQKPRVLCLTASPVEDAYLGGTVKKLNQLCSTFSVVPVYPREALIEFESMIKTQDPQWCTTQRNPSEQELINIIVRFVENVLQEKVLKEFDLVVRSCYDQNFVRDLKNIQQLWKVNDPVYLAIDLSLTLYKRIETIQLFGTKVAKEDIQKIINNRKTNLSNEVEQELEKLNQNVMSVPDVYSERLAQLYYELDQFEEGRIIIFVRTRDSGRQLIEKLKVKYSEMSPQVIFGHGGLDGMDYESDQSEVLQKFKQGHCQLLVATSVVEEGIDVSSCNLVISFEAMTSAKSMMQMRGRAREHRSKFIVMCDTSERDMQQKLQMKEKNMIEAVKSVCNEIKQSQNASNAYKEWCNKKYDSCAPHVKIVVLCEYEFSISELTFVVSLSENVIKAYELSSTEYSEEQSLLNYAYKDLVRDDLWIKRDALPSVISYSVKKYDFGVINFIPCQSEFFNSSKHIISVMKFTALWTENSLHIDSDGINVVGPAYTITITWKSITKPILLQLDDGRGNWQLLFRFDFKPEVYKIIKGENVRVCESLYGEEFNSIVFSSNHHLDDILNHEMLKIPIYYAKIKFVPFEAKVQEEMPPSRTNIPPHMFYVKRCVITPTTKIWFDEELIMHNRVTRHLENIHPGSLLRVQFRDEDAVTNVSFGKFTSYIAQVIKHGIMSKDYDLFKYLGCSNSQLKKHSFWFMKESDQNTIADVHRWMGVFDHRYIHKYVSRMGLMFTSCFEVETEPDVVEYDMIEDNGSFTDGIGKMSELVAKAVTYQLNLKSIPSAVQIRSRGFKGVVAISPEIASEMKIEVRDSMSKFEPGPHHSFNVVSWSDYNICYLNQQSIILMSSLGVPDGVFLQMLQDQLDNLEDMFVDNEKAYNVIRCYTTIPHLDRARDANVDFLQDEFWANVLVLIYNKQINDLVDKTRIIVPKSQNVLGVIDEYRVLPENCIFLQIDDHMGNKQVIQGQVIVYRNPCMHPGDVRRYTAVDCNELHHLRNCVAFSQQGIRPAPTDLAGGDLDGDRFSVIWDERLVDAFPINHSPDDYTAVSGVVLDTLPEYLAKFRDKSEDMGKIATAWKVWTDIKPLKAKDLDCMYLSKQFSLAVDYAKTGVPGDLPDHLKPERFPDFMNRKNEIKEIYESKNVLGQIYRRAKSFDVIKNIKFIKNQDNLSKDQQEEIETLIFDHYKSQMTLIKDYCKIESDEQIASGIVVKWNPRYDEEQRNVEDLMKTMYNSIVRDVRVSFFEEFGGELIAFSRAEYSSRIKKKLQLWCSIAESRNDHTFKWGVFGDTIEIKASSDSNTTIDSSIRDFLLKNESSIRDSYQKRVETVENLQGLIRKCYPNASLSMHGSSSLLLFDCVHSDVDVILENAQLRDINDRLKRFIPREFKNDGKFPIIRFSYKSDFLHYPVDMVTNSDGLYKIKYIKSKLIQDKSMYMSLFVLMSWARALGIISQVFPSRALIYMYIDFCFKGKDRVHYNVTGDFKPLDLLIHDENYNSTNLLQFLRLVGTCTTTHITYYDPVLHIQEIKLQDSIRAEFLRAYLTLKCTANVNSIMTVQGSDREIDRVITLGVKFTQLIFDHHDFIINQWCDKFKVKLKSTPYMNRNRLVVTITGTHDQCNEIDAYIKSREYVSRLSPSKSHESFVKGSGLILFERGLGITFIEHDHPTHHHHKHEDRRRYRMCCVGDEPNQNQLTFKKVCLAQLEYMFKEKMVQSIQIGVTKCTIRIGKHYLLNMNQELCLRFSEQRDFCTILDKNRRYNSVKTDYHLDDYYDVDDTMSCWYYEPPLKPKKEPPPKVIVKELDTNQSTPKQKKNPNITDTMYTCINDDIDIDKVLQKLGCDPSDVYKTEEIYNGTILEKGELEKRVKFDQYGIVSTASTRPLTWLSCTKLEAMDDLDMRIYIKTKRPISTGHFDNLTINGDCTLTVSDKMKYLGIVRHVKSKWYKYNKFEGTFFVVGEVYYYAMGIGLVLKRKDNKVREFEVKLRAPEHGQMEKFANEAWEISESVKRAFLQC